MIRTSVTSTDLADLAVAIRYEADGAVMRKELLRNLRKAAAPAVLGAKSSILSMPSTGLRKSAGGSLRAAIAKEIKTQVALTTRSAKVKIRVRKKTVRGFKNPAQRTNAAAGWRHPVFPEKGKQRDAKWIRQIGKAGWFDNEMRKHRPEYEAAVKSAVDNTAARIARNT